MMSLFRRRARVVRLSQEGLDRFVRSGGTVSLDEWASLPESVQALLAEAGQRVAADRAAMLATALSSAAGLGEVASVVDGGALRTQFALQRMADEASRKLGAA